ncbi:hypothetical protein QKT49_gp329 [Acanthamoeba castellanii medusavirus]|uniref:Uncharacterized protein n=1 Tax=Acanthamoeba castellanii medusavirus J1 TaxID=3114988 RepID=A0A3T1CX82_9VIRU|nr:hypothetical protein QKT49_gp329 [Acanthamoeba castellanii medusavirus]BBI30434.1 hypothetical protein [Acanthamoeba castellanii medusavirus J1]
MTAVRSRLAELRRIVAELNCYREQLAIAEDLLQESSYEDDPKTCMRHNHMRKHVRMEMNKLVSELRRLGFGDEYDSTRKHVNRALCA